MSTQSDEALVKRIQNGEIKLFEILMTRYQSKLLRYAHYLTNNSENASDVVQTTFIQTYTNIQSFDVSKVFSSWIYRICHNEAMKLHRSEKRFFHVSLDEIIPYFSSKETPETEVVTKEQSTFLKKNINLLKPNYRSIIILYYFENKSYEEISDILHIPVSTVGIRIRRAKERLKQLCLKT
jgi:RNA polymerase sigma-70 factor, ECF subfamily